jgi:hypothetical protein
VDNTQGAGPIYGRVDSTSISGDTFAVVTAAGGREEYDLNSVSENHEIVEAKSLGGAERLLNKFNLYCGNCQNSLAKDAFISSLNDVKPTIGFGGGGIGLSIGLPLYDYLTFNCNLIIAESSEMELDGTNLIHSGGGCGAVIYDHC